MKKDIDEAKKIRKCILLAFLGISLEISMVCLPPDWKYLWAISFVLVIITIIRLFIITR